MILDLIFALAAVTAYPCQSAGLAIPMQSLQDAILQKICQEYSPHYAQTELYLLSESKVFDRELAAKSAIQIQLGTLKSGRLPVQLLWLNTAGQRQESTLWYRVQGMAHAWVAQRDLNAEFLLKNGDFQQKLVDFAALDLDSTLTLPSTAGMVLTRAVRKGQAVLPNLLRPEPLIARQEKIDLWLFQNGVQIRLPAVALEVGWQQGDSVQVMTQAGKTSIKAKVTSKGVAYVQ